MLYLRKLSLYTKDFLMNEYIDDEYILTFEDEHGNPWSEYEGYDEV